MWVKICANTSLDDALLAAEFGADAVGFVFAPSSRQVTSGQVANIVPHLPPGLEKVGVFPAWSAVRIAETALQSGLTTVQLHGGVDPILMLELAGRLHGNVTIIQTVHWTVDEAASAAAEVETQLHALALVPHIARVLIDSKLGAATGGTGVPFNWSAAKTAFGIHPNSILAGGLTPENVRHAIQQVQPWGIDVASGVESSPGKKDRAKLQRFLTAART